MNNTIKSICVGHNCKKAGAFFLLFFLLQVANLFAQSGNNFGYQSMVRRADGTALEKNITVKISLLFGSENGTVLYAEKHQTVTNINGSYMIEVGSGIKLAGSIEAINWQSSSIFLSAEIDTIGNGTYSLLERHQILSVPYASFTPNGLPNTPGKHGDVLTVCNGVPQWGPCAIGTAVLGTIGVADVGSTFAKADGEVSSDGDGFVIERGFCWDTVPAPTTSKFKSSNGGGEGKFNSNISSLLPETRYYLRAYAINETGTSYSNEIVFTTKGAPQRIAGENYLGGVIVYMLKAGDPGFEANTPHGIIAASSDQSSSSAWAAASFNTYVQNNELGKGRQNADQLFALLGDKATAVVLCRNLRINGYDDWFLPNATEFEKVFQFSNGTGPGKFLNDGPYWTSCEDQGSAGALAKAFVGGQAQSYNKFLPFSVRAIRYF